MWFPNRMLRDQKVMPLKGRRSMGAMYLTPKSDAIPDHYGHDCACL
jgi:hypothetical protein